MTRPKTAGELLREQNLMNRLIRAEDAARQVRLMAGRRIQDVPPNDVAKLADAVAQGFQAMREILEDR